MSSKKKRPFFAHYKKIFKNEFRGYNGKALLNDAIAGITVGAVALPLALAFGAASVNAENAAFGIAAGLITAIVAGIVSGLLGGGSFQISGPTGAMTVVLGTIVGGKYGLQGMFLATFFAGCILLIAGLLRFGKLVQFIPRPVVTGFTTGIALVIALGQFGNFFGVTLKGETIIGKITYLFTDCLGQINLSAVLCSLAVMLIMIFYPKKAAKYVPGSLVAIIVITAVCAIFPIGVGKIGDIPRSIVNTEVLNISGVTPGMIGEIAQYSLTIAILGMIESLLCGTCAAQMKKEKFDSNVELIAQGLGNMVIPFLGGVPSTAAIARTSVAIRSGGRTRLTSLFQSVFLVACMFVLSGAIGLVPYAALAGVLMMTAFNMNDWKQIRSFFSKKMWDAVALFIVTMLATVLLDLTYAIVIGVALAVVLFINKLTKVQIQYSDEKLITERRAVVMFSIGAYFFPNANEFRKGIEACGICDYDEFIFSFRGIVYTDITAVEMFEEAIKDLRAAGKEVYFIAVPDTTMRVFERTGFCDFIGRDNFFEDRDDLILATVKELPAAKAMQ